MAVLEGATTGALADVDPTSKTLRITTMPKDVAGAYGAGAVTGVLPAALGTGSVVFAMRSGPSVNTKRCYVTRIFMRAIVRTVASVFTDWSLEIVRFSAASATGGTAMTIFNKRQAGGNVASVCTPSGPEGGDMRIATTAALGMAGATFDTATILALQIPVISATVPAVGAVFERTYENDAGLEHPVELGAGDGIAFRTVGATPTGLTVNLLVGMSWSER